MPRNTPAPATLKHLRVWTPHRPRRQLTKYAIELRFPALPVSTVHQSSGECIFINYLFTPEKRAFLSWDERYISTHVNLRKNDVYQRKPACNNCRTVSDSCMSKNKVCIVRKNVHTDIVVNLEKLYCWNVLKDCYTASKLVRALSILLVPTFLRTKYTSIEMKNINQEVLLWCIIIIIIIMNEVLFFYYDYYYHYFIIIIIIISLECQGWG